MPGVRTRRPRRLATRDYHRLGIYFVTIVTANRFCLFGNVTDTGTMELNGAGRIVVDEWMHTVELRPNVRLDEFVVMPNHLHGLIHMVRDASAPNSHEHEGFASPSQSLGAIVRGFKGAATKQVNAVRNWEYGSIWQDNFHDHIVRGAADLVRIREYIRLNPSRWDKGPRKSRSLP